MEQPVAEDVTETSPPDPMYLPVLYLLWQRRGLLLKAAGIGLVAATILAFSIPKHYQSTVQLMPPGSPSMSAGLMAAMTGVAMPSSALAGLAGSLLNPRTTGGALLGIVNSRTAQDALINRFDLRRVYNVKRYVDARKKLGKWTDVSEDRKSGIITITVTDRDPRRARDLAGAYVEELNHLVVQLDTSSAHRERVFLEERLKAVKEDLDFASRQLSQFSSRNATLDVQSQEKAMFEAAAKLQGQLIAAQSELSGLEAVYSGNNVRVQAARARVGELQHELHKMGGTRAEEGTDLNASQLYPSLRQLPLLGVTYSDLYRRAKVQEAVFEILTKQYELAKIEEAKEIPTIKVLDPPDLPEKKSFPPRLLIMVLGTLLSLSVVVVWRVGVVWWNQIAAQHPLKQFAGEAVGTIRVQQRWPSKGSSADTATSPPKATGADQQGHS